MTRFSNFVAAGCFVLSAGAAGAQDGAASPADGAEIRNGQQIGDWIVSCDAVTVRQTVCRLVQEQSMREGGALVARFIAVPVVDGAILLAQVPMGVYLPGGAVYRFGDSETLEQRDMIWQSCADQVCEAAAPLDEEELALFESHSDILFGFRPAAGDDPVVLRVSIEGFAEAIATLRE